MRANRFLVIALTLAGIWFSAGSAMAKSWYFEEFNVDITVNEDSSFDVVEKHTYVFDGDFSWVNRDITKRQLSSIENVMMTDEEGNELPNYEVDFDYTDDVGNQYVRVRNNFAISNETVTWLVKYHVNGGLDFSNSWTEGYDRLYWNAISSDRDVPIESCRVTVQLPGDYSADQVDFMSYAYYDYQSEYLPGGKVLFTAEDLTPYSSFTIDVVWPTGQVDLPAQVVLDANLADFGVVINGIEVDQVYNRDYVFYWPDGEHEFEFVKWGYRTIGDRVDLESEKSYRFNLHFKELWLRWLVRWLGYLMIPGAILLVWLLWYAVGRDQGLKGTIVAWYEPYEGMRPAEVGTLLKENAQMQFLPAMLVDLAVRGYIKIKEKEKKGLLFSSQTYTFYKVKEFTGLKDYEHKLLEGMFGSKKSVSLYSLRNKFYKKISGITTALMDQVVADGYFDSDPRKVRMWHYIYGVLGLLGGLGLTIVVSIFLNWWPLSALWFVSGLIYLFSVGIMPRKSRKGGEALEKLLGFKEYLYRAERYRLQDDTPETFEKYLPYAMIFGVEKQWAERFKDIYKTPPDWYEGGDMTSFNAVYFANSLTSMSTATAAGMSYVQSSGSGGYSSGGGSFGGGFSGGGGGGGGSSAG